MQVEGLEIADLDGLHEDDWCRPKVSGRVIATQPGQAFAVRYWTPADPTAPSSIVTLRLDHARTFKYLVPSGTVHECRTDIRVEPGSEISFEIASTNRPAPQGDDIRELSFVLSSIGIY